MATFTGSIDAFFDSDARFRAWAQAIHDAIVGCGLVNTSDTGQVNLATVAQPGAADTFQGFKVYRFADDLQGTTPIFLKVEFGSGGAADRPALRVTAGRATDGAGTISGGNVTKTLKPGGSKASGNTLPYYISGRCAGAHGHLAVAVNVDGASDNYGFFFSLERPKTVDGADTADGFLFCASSPFFAFSVAKPDSGAGASGPSSDAWAAIVDNGATFDYGTESAGNNEAGDNVRMPLNGKMLFSYNVITAEGTLAKAQTYACDTLGESRTYMHLGNIAGGGTGLSPGAHAAANICWEGAAAGADTIFTGTKAAGGGGGGGGQSPTVPTGGQLWPRGSGH